MWTELKPFFLWSDRASFRLRVIVRCSDEEVVALWRAEVLFDLGLCPVRGYLKKPAQASRTREAGLKIVERVSIQDEQPEQAGAYLKTKKEKLGHLPTLVRAVRVSGWKQKRPRAVGPRPLYVYSE